MSSQYLSPALQDRKFNRSTIEGLIHVRSTSRANMWAATSVINAAKEAGYDMTELVTVSESGRIKVDSVLYAQALTLVGRIVETELSFDQWWEQNQ